MTEIPYALQTVVFLDWDDTTIGVLRVPKSIRDVRPLVQFFTAYNMIHPDIRAILWADPWAEERDRKWEEARQAYPRRKIYPEEVIIPQLDSDGQILYDGPPRGNIILPNGTVVAVPRPYHVLRHSLCYHPADYIPTHQRGQSFHPAKGG